MAKKINEEKEEYVKILSRLKSIGMSESSSPNSLRESIDCLPTIEERIKVLLDIADNKNSKANQMLFFVMYDIESNKVRRLVVKYLEKKGLFRVQKSIFLGQLPTQDYDQIKNDLAEVQSAYQNEDSILVVPISTDYLSAMKVIGKNLNIDLITRKGSTLFF